jgi:hypothetical protein
MGHPLRGIRGRIVWDALREAVGPVVGMLRAGQVWAAAGSEPMVSARNKARTPSNASRDCSVATLLGNGERRTAMGCGSIFAFGDPRGE